MTFDNGQHPSSSTPKTVEQEAEDFIKDLSASIRSCDFAIRDFNVRVNVLLDELSSVQAYRETLKSMTNANEQLSHAKDIQRKLSIWSSGGINLNNHSQFKLRQQKLNSSLEACVQVFNELSKKTEYAVGRANTLREASKSNDSTTAPPSRLQTDSFSHHESRDEHLQGVRQIKQSVEATQQIFDELGSLVRQQAPHVDLLENAAATAKDFSRDAAVELEKEFIRRRRQSRRTWATFVVILCTTFVIIYLYTRSSTPPSLLPASSDSVSPLQQQPILQVGASLENKLDDLVANAQAAQDIRASAPSSSPPSFHKNIRHFKK